MRSYPDSYGTKYYGGPTCYYTKNEIGFTNIKSGELIKMSNTEAKEYSEDLREMLKINSAKKDDYVYSQIEFSAIDQTTYDPKISKAFAANVPYLVIVSAYNPSSSSSVGEFYLNFE